MRDLGKQRPWLYHIALWVPIGLGMLMIAGILGGMVLVAPMAFLISLGGALIYTLLGYLVFFRFPGFRFGVSCMALLWGFCASLMLAMLAGDGLMEMISAARLDAVSYSFTGAWPEELCKGLGILLLFLLFYDRPWHGMLLGAFVGLGFEIIENMLYGTMGGLFDTVSDERGALIMWGLRAVAGPWLHVVFSSFVGLGIGELLTGRKIAGLWILVGFAAHFAWNLQIDQGIAVMVLVGVVIYPLAIWTFIQQARRGRADTTCYRC